jgi:hypothetical protein
MLNFENISNRIFAAVSAVTLSAVCFAVAIAPATQNAAMTGMMA